MKSKIFYAFLLAFLGVICNVSAQNLNRSEMDKTVLKCVPLPPDTSSALFANDLHQYEWGKSIRNTPRGQQARADAVWKIDSIMKVFSPAFGIKITRTNTPSLFKLMHNVMLDAYQATLALKENYSRVRPYVRFHETTLLPSTEEILAKSGSFPSAHSCAGWAIALVLSEINPSRMDTIMARGYQFGQSRVIAGFHWQSDVDAGRFAGSAVFARLQANAAFQQQLALAKKEFLRKKQK